MVFHFHHLLLQCLEEEFFLNLFQICVGFSTRCYLVLGVYTVTVDVEQKKVSVSGNVDPDTLIRKLVKNGKHAELLSPKLPGGARNNQFQKQLQVDNGAKASQKGGGGGKKQAPMMKQLQPQQAKGFNLKMPGFMKNPNSVKFDVPEDDDDVWSDFDDGDVFDELDEMDGGFDDDFEVDLKQMKNFKPMKGDGGQKKGAAANYMNKMPPFQKISGDGPFPAGMNMMPHQRSGGNGNGGGGNVSMNPAMTHMKGDGNGQKKGAIVGGKKGGDVGGKKNCKNSGGGGTGGGKDGKGAKGGGGGGGGNNNPHAGTPFQMGAGGGVGGPFQNPSGMNMMPPQRCASGNGVGGNISMHPAMTHMRNGGPMSGQQPDLFPGGGNPYHQQQYLAAMMQQQQQQRMMMMNGGGGGSMAYSRATPPVAAAVNYMNPPPDFTHVFSDENTNSCSIM